MIDLRVCALAGGVGGARLADGLYRALGHERLTIVVNTADDFDLLGLRISPDLDTVMYTLAGIANPEAGWGLDGETFHAMDMLARYGQPTWFRLGDRDLATHLRRTALLREGRTLSAVTRELKDQLGVHAQILPMCDAPVASWIVTPDGRRLAFQEYFVERGHRDAVAEVSFTGLELATLSDSTANAFVNADLFVLCPSNPFVSLNPILAVPTLRERLRQRRVPSVAVSPVIGGQSVKGPAADMLRSLGHEVSAVGVARLYRGLVDAFVIDASDAGLASSIEKLGMEPLVQPAVMHTAADRVELARHLIQWATNRRAAQGVVA